MCKFPLILTKLAQRVYQPKVIPPKILNRKVQKDTKYSAIQSPFKQCIIMQTAGHRKARNALITYTLLNSLLIALGRGEQSSRLHLRYFKNSETNISAHFGVIISYYHAAGYSLVCVCACVCVCVGRVTGELPHHDFIISLHQSLVSPTKISRKEEGQE